MVKKLSNDVACGEDFSPDFTIEHVAKTSNGDVGHQQQDDDDVVSVVDGGGESSSENPREEVPGPVLPPSTLPSPSRENPGKVDDPSLASALPSPIGTTLPSPSRENAGSSAEGTPLTARKLFATPDSAMKVREAPKSNSDHNLIVE